MEQNKDHIEIGLNGEVFIGTRSLFRTCSLHLLPNAKDRTIIDFCIREGFSPLTIRGEQIELNKYTKPNTEIFELGDSVVCDLCNKQWRGNSQSGGFLFQSKAVCPDCAPDFLVGVKKYREDRFIVAYCPAEKSFWEWTLSLRQGRHSVILSHT